MVVDFGLHDKGVSVMASESIYEQRPWVKQYPAGVPADIEVPEVSLVEMFERACERWKKKTAIVFYGNKISFHDLHEKVDRFAAALQDVGVRKGDVVAFLLLNSPEFFIAFYACLKAGAIVSPISPVYVSPEIRYQLENSGAKTIICQDILWENVEKTGFTFGNVIMTNIADSLPATKRMLGKSILREVYQKMAVPSKVIFQREGFYQMKDLIQEHKPAPQIVPCQPREDLVLLPYTGGTTGPPKGVMVTHFNLIASHCSFSAFYSVLEDGIEATVSYQPFYHAAGFFAGVQEAIIRGWTQVVLTTPDLDEIINALMSIRATYFQGAPTIYEVLKDFQKTSRFDWRRLKVIISAADALHEATAKEWEARTKTQLHDYWGMTETAALGTGTPIGKRRIGSCGVPLPNVVAAIVDPEKDEFMPVGELGELAICSSSVCKGYWKMPDATRDSQAVINGKVWWRTGDIMKMDEDGYFWFYDRKRDLIKYKGLRVYAREVEEALRLHPAVKEAGVIGVPDKVVGENVKAYVVLEADARGRITEQEVMEFCRERLAHYKVPRIIEFVGEIPRTDIGKVSRRELREMEA